MSRRSSRNASSEDLYSVDLALDQGEARERELLTCPYCFASLEAIMLDTNEATGEQRFFWTCRNFRKYSCVFPIGLPSEVFFLKRTAAEKEHDVIPKPDILRLPRKYRSLYPTIFANEPPPSNSTTRRGSSASIHVTDSSPIPVLSPTPTSSSSGSTNPPVEDLPQKISSTDKSAEASTWCDRTPGPNQEAAGSSNIQCGSEVLVSSESTSQGPTTSSSGSGITWTSSSTALENDRGDLPSCSGASYSPTCSSSEASEECNFTEFMCDQLQYTGVDISRLEDEELIRRMAGVVKKLHDEKRRTRFPGYLTSAEYRASIDYLYNLDVAPIKRKLSVLSADLPHAIAVMRSKCDIDTMLDAMGGTVPPMSSAAKRARFMCSKQDLRERVESILKCLAKRKEDSVVKVNKTAEAHSADDDPAANSEWYEGEDGPSTSGQPAPDSEQSTLSEEQRLSALVQSKVRTHVENSAARRRAHRRRRVEVSSHQGMPQPTPEHATPLHLDVFATGDHFNNDSNLLSFDSPYAEHTEDDHAYQFHQENLAHVLEPSALTDNTISDTQSHLILHPPYSESPVDDDEFKTLFEGYEFLY